MRTLLILRHAKSAYDAVEDFDRSLKDSGIKDAGKVAAFMDNHDLVPDLILCSPARRTRETIRPVTDQWPAVPVNFQDVLYLATPGEIYKAIQDVPDSEACLMVVGHNPGLLQLTRMLAAEPVDSAFPTATLACFHCEIESWAHLQPGRNKLVHLFEGRHAS